MKSNMLVKVGTILILMLTLSIGLAQAQGGSPQSVAQTAASVGTSFTYQGKLTDGGNPANGTYDFQFTLYDAVTGGSTVGTVTKGDVTVTDGLFAVTLDFGNVFDGTALWLKVEVRPGSSTGTYTPLDPRQALTAAPYALSLRPGATIIGNVSINALYIRNTATSGTTNAVYGISDSTSGRGVLGVASAGSGATIGVYGVSYSTDGRGVYGSAAATNGSTSGVYGTSDSTSGRGVAGVVGATSGTTSGVYGVSYSTDGRGVYGSAAATSGTTSGVYGVSYSTDGRGVYGSAAATSGYTYGIYGTSASTNGRGVEGVATAATGYTYGVWGESASADGRAVTGWATAISGTTRGVYGKSVSPSGYGVYGWASDTSGTDTSFGVYGRSESFSGLGVYGYAAATTGSTYGVWGESKSTGGIGVKGYASATCCSTYGVYGVSTSTGGGRGVYGYASATTGNSIGVYGQSNSASGYAGYFIGNVHVNGTLSKSAGSFKIDHPLDPANQYLSHSFVESPDMMNVYNGNITLGTDGTVWVYMPDYFEALNQDFRYQLTSIGAPGPNLYIAQKIANNRFKIAGGTPGMEVSWQVTGIRHDPYAVQNPIVVEEPKPADEKGTYLYPQGYGQPKSMGLDFQRDAEKDVQAGAMNDGQ